MRPSLLSHVGRPRVTLARLALAAASLLVASSLASAQDSFHAAAEAVNKKMVKIYGSGGFKGLPSYGSGIVVSPDGYILTVNNHILQGNNGVVKIHLADGRAFDAKTLAQRPELDLAVLKIDAEVEKLPHYDIAKSAAAALAETGDWILCHSNQFAIAVRNEPMSVQHGTVMALANLKARKGVFDPPFVGEVYFIDTIANNPGAAGGIVTNRKGDLLGIIGRELKSSLTETWVNYAVPIQAVADVYYDDDKSDKLIVEKVSVARFVDEVMKGKHKLSSTKKRDKDAKGAYTGIVFVPNPILTTPPYIDEVVPGSPAAKAKLQPDDLIVYVDGELCPSIKAFRDILKQTNPGTMLQLEVQRGTQLKTIKLVLEELPKTK